MDVPSGLAFGLLGNQDRAIGRERRAAGVVDQQASMRSRGEPAESRVGAGSSREHAVRGDVVAAFDHPVGDTGNVQRGSAERDEDQAEAGILPACASVTRVRNLSLDRTVSTRNGRRARIA